MVSLLVRVLSGVSQLCYIVGRSRLTKAGVLAILAIAIASVVVNRSARSEDLTIYPLPAAHLRVTVVNRYVRTTGNILINGAYQVQTKIAGVIGSSLRFIPFLPTDSAEPVILLDEKLPSANSDNTPTTIVGKYLRGDDELPNYYLKVSNPPSMALYDVLGLVSVLLLAGALAGGVITWLVRRVDYAISLPFTAVAIAVKPGVDEKGFPPYLLWYGSLGAAYGDVILREVPVSFKAIPAEAKLVPVFDCDAWTITIHRARAVSLTTIATSHGALPAMKLEFEDERGITRDGLIAGSNRNVVDSILNVLRFVG
jgi:hypothetical protein